MSTLARTRKRPNVFLHVVWPTLTFGVILLVLVPGRVDLLAADWIYQQGGNAWAWHDAWLTRDVIHEGGRALVATMFVMLLLSFTASWLLPAGRRYRRGLSYLFLSTVCAALLVNVLKEVTRIDCPWDLIRYGGAHSYSGLFDLASWSSREGACFPAGHASGAYAWFGGYYLAVEYRPHWRRVALIAVVSLGLLFGIGQQVRGAHFVSHDFCTAFLCWFVATALHRLFYHRPDARFSPAPNRPDHSQLHQELSHGFDR